MVVASEGLVSGVWCCDQMDSSFTLLLLLPLLLNSPPDHHCDLRARAPGCSSSLRACLMWLLFRDLWNGKCRVPEQDVESRLQRTQPPFGATDARGCMSPHLENTASALCHIWISVRLCQPAGGSKLFSSACKSNSGKSTKATLLLPSLEERII